MKTNGCVRRRFELCFHFHVRLSVMMEIWKWCLCFICCGGGFFPFLLDNRASNPFTVWWSPLLGTEPCPLPVHHLWDELEHRGSLSLSTSAPGLPDILQPCRHRNLVEKLPSKSGGCCGGRLLLTASEWCHTVICCVSLMHLFIYYVSFWKYVLIMSSDYKETHTAQTMRSEHIQIKNKK